MDPMGKAFVANIHHFIVARGLELVHFAKGQRKDDVTARVLAGFAGPEGVLYAGRAREKSNVWRTQRRHHSDGSSYAWLVRASAFINFFYFYCVDADFGPFFVKFSTYRLGPPSGGHPHPPSGRQFTAVLLLPGGVLKTGRTPPGSTLAERHRRGLVRLMEDSPS